MQRRTFIGAVAAAATGGCLTRTRDAEPTPEPTHDYAVEIEYPYEWGALFDMALDAGPDQRRVSGRGVERIPLPEDIHRIEVRARKEHRGFDPLAVRVLDGDTVLTQNAMSHYPVEVGVETPL